MIVVELEGTDAGGVGLEPEDHDVGHQAHVVGDVLGDAVGGAGDVGGGEGGAPAFETAALAGGLDPHLDIPDGVEGCAGEEVACLGAVDVALEGFLVVEVLAEEKAVAEVVEGLGDLAKLHGLALALGSPFPAVEAVAGEQGGDAHGGLASVGQGCGPGSVTPDAEGFHPWEGHGDAEAAKEGATSETEGAHGGRLVSCLTNGWCRVASGKPRGKA